MFKVSNKDTRHQNDAIGFEHISHLVSTVSIVNFEHVIAGWVPWFHFRPIFHFFHCFPGVYRDHWHEMS